MLYRIKKFFINSLSIKKTSSINTSWGCQECGGYGCYGGSGYVADPNAPWWNFWSTVKCENCMGSGNNIYPTEPEDFQTRIKMRGQVIKTGESDWFIGRDGKKRKWKTNWSK